MSQNPPFRSWMPIGIAIGAAIGAAIDNVAAGIAVGLLCAVMISSHGAGRRW